MIRNFCSYFIAICCLTPLAGAADWTQFRGTTGTGHGEAKNLPVEWGPDKNVAWRTEVPGSGWSSPCLAGEKLYLTSAVPASETSGSDIELKVLCYDAAAGNLLWEKTVFLQDGTTAPAIHRKNSHASPTPIVDGERLFVHFGHQGTACLSTGGDVLWANRELAYPPVHGNGGSPLLVDNLLVFSCDGADKPFVVALDAASGQVRWKYERPTDSAKKFAFSTPEVITVGGQKQIISVGAGMVSALDPASGDEIWHVTFDGYSVIPKPVFAQGLVILSTGYDSPTMIAIEPDGRGNVTDTHVAWTLTKGAPHTPSPLVIGDELYLISDAGIASCVSVKTGKQLWQQRVGGDYSASPVFADGKIYIVSEEGEGTVFRPGKKFVKLGENGFGERTLASYAVGENALFVRTEKALYRVHQMR